MPEMGTTISSDENIDPEHQERDAQNINDYLQELLMEEQEIWDAVKRFLSSSDRQDPRRRQIEELLNEEPVLLKEVTSKMERNEVLRRVVLETENKCAGLAPAVRSNQKNVKCLSRKLSKEQKAIVRQDQLAFQKEILKTGASLHVLARLPLISEVREGSQTIYERKYLTEQSAELILRFEELRFLQ